MMTENADKRENKFICYVWMKWFLRIIFFELSIKQSIGLSFII